jgi:hypothetical protein
LSLTYVKMVSIRIRCNKGRKSRDSKNRARSQELHNRQKRPVRHLFE